MQTYTQLIAELDRRRDADALIFGIACALVGALLTALVMA